MVPGERLHEQDDHMFQQQSSMQHNDQRSHAPNHGKAYVPRHVIADCISFRRGGCSGFVNGECCPYRHVEYPAENPKFCREFDRTKSCRHGVNCAYLHASTRRTACQKFLKNICNKDENTCLYSHSIEHMQSGWDQGPRRQAPQRVPFHRQSRQEQYHQFREQRQMPMQMPPKFYPQQMMGAPQPNMHVNPHHQFQQQQGFPQMFNGGFPAGFPFNPMMMSMMSPQAFQMRNWYAQQQFQAQQAHAQQLQQQFVQQPQQQFQGYNGSGNGKGNYKGESEARELTSSAHGVPENHYDTGHSYADKESGVQKVPLSTSTPEKPAEVKKESPSPNESQKVSTVTPPCASTSDTQKVSTVTQPTQEKATDQVPGASKSASPEKLPTKKADPGKRLSIENTKAAELRAKLQVRKQVAAAIKKEATAKNTTKSTTTTNTESANPSNIKRKREAEVDSGDDFYGDENKDIKRKKGDEKVDKANTVDTKQEQDEKKDGEKVQVNGEGNVTMKEESKTPSPTQAKPDASPTSSSDMEDEVDFELDDL